MSFFIVDKLDTCSQDLNSDFTLKSCLFGGIKLAKNAGPDKYVYKGSGIGFDSIRFDSKQNSRFKSKRVQHDCKNK